jgi:hypothetical protein
MSSFLVNDVRALMTEELYFWFNLLFVVYDQSILQLIWIELRNQSSESRTVELTESSDLIITTNDVHTIAHAIGLTILFVVELNYTVIKGFSIELHKLRTAILGLLLLDDTNDISSPNIGISLEDDIRV